MEPKPLQRLAQQSTTMACHFNCSLTLGEASLNYGRLVGVGCGLFKPDINVCTRKRCISFHHYLLEQASYMTEEHHASFCDKLPLCEFIYFLPENFMTGYHIVFDREKMILGWKDSNCECGTVFLVS